MGIGISIFLIAAGAVMRFALTVKDPTGVNVHTVGVILMIVGGLGLVAALTIFGSMGSRRRGAGVVEERTVVEDRRL